MSNSKITIKNEPLPETFVLQTTNFIDTRGLSSKVFNEKNFENLGLEFKPQEYFYSKNKTLCLDYIKENIERESFKLYDEQAPRG